MENEVPEVKDKEEAWARLMRDSEKIKEDSKLLTQKYLFQKKFAENGLQ